MATLCDILGCAPFELVAVRRVQGAPGAQGQAGDAARVGTTRFQAQARARDLEPAAARSAARSTHGAARALHQVRVRPLQAEARSHAQALHHGHTQGRWQRHVLLPANGYVGARGSTPRVAPLLAALAASSLCAGHAPRTDATGAMSARHVPSAEQARRMAVGARGLRGRPLQAAASDGAADHRQATEVRDNTEAQGQSTLAC